MSAAPALADLVRLAEIIRALSPKQLEAWLTCGERIVDGMPAEEAEALMWCELAEAQGSLS